MTNPLSLEQVLPVEQCDREQAALIDEALDWVDTQDPEGFRDGSRDEHPVVQGLARHRLSSSLQSVGGVERIAEWLRGPGPDRDNGGPCRHVEHVQGFCSCDGLADAIERGDHKQ